MKNVAVLFVFFISMPYKCSGQTLPKAKYQIFNITVSRTIYRYIYTIPDDTFTDEEDGNFRNLKKAFTKLDGSQIPIDNWIQFNSVNKLLIYTSRNLIDNTPSQGFEYLLTVTDKDGNTARTIYNFKFDRNKRPIPVYSMSLQLTSTISPFFRGKDVQVLFYIQEEKLFPYSQKHDQGIAKIKDMITESLIITRTRNPFQTRIQMITSTPTFLTTVCNIQDIIRIRSKTRGQYTDEFKNIFRTELTYVDQSEQFNGPCDYLSGEKPIKGTDNLQNAIINFAEYFTIRVPSKLFLPPTKGNIMEITLNLRYQNGSHLSNSSWVNTNGKLLKDGVTLEGYVPYKVASQQQAFIFQLVAMTPLLEVSDPNLLTLSISGFQSIVKNYIIVFTSSSPVQTTYVSFIKSFISAMSIFLSKSEKEILIYNYLNNQNYTLLAWTLREFTSLGFKDVTKLGKVTSQLKRVKNKPSQGLLSVMSNIGFEFGNLSVEISGDMLKPIVLKIQGSLLGWATFFRYTIPDDAFIDATDGIHLNFSIIPSGNIFAPNNWLAVKNRTIYGVPIADQIKMNVVKKFQLRVTNSLGNYITDNFQVLSNTDVPLFSYAYRFTVKYSEEETSVANMLFSFMNRLIDFFMDKNRNQLIVLDVITFKTSRSVQIRYFNSSFKVIPCDTKAIIKTNALLFSGRDPNPKLVQAMKPEFIVEDIVSESLESCTRNSPPLVHDPKSLSNDVGPHTIIWGSMFRKKLSDTLFYDEEDGWTKELKITLKIVGSSLDLAFNYWIFYNQTEFTVYAVPIQETFNALGPKGEEKFILQAEDSGGKSVAIEYIMIPTGTATDYYTVTMSINLFGMAKMNYPQQLYTIVKTLENIFGRDYVDKICVKTYVVTLTNESNGFAILKWTHCDIPLRACNFDIINNVRQKIYNPNSSIINSKLKNRLPAFQVVGVSDSGLDPCGLNPPQIQFQIPTQTITFCGLYTYEIPRDAFVDKEDGNTRNLSLSLTLKGKSILEPWLEFDNKTQVISMLLTKTMDTNSFERMQNLILTATDASMLKRSQIIKVEIMGNSVPVDFKFVLMFTPSIAFQQSGKNTFIEIARKTIAYISGDASGFEAIQSAKTTTGIFVYEFGNCTLSYSPCQAVEMQNYRNLLKETTFQAVFSPEFQVVSTSESLVGPCAADASPEVDVFWQKPIAVNITKTYTITVPQNTFKDKEQGNTRNLDLQLTDLFRREINKTYWVQFDAGSQTLTIVATKEIALSLQPSYSMSFLLFAYDIQRQYATMTLDIQINFPREEPSHYVSMSLLILSTELQRSTFTNIYNTLRTSIMTYFRDDLKLHIISYTRTTNDFSTSLQVVWNNATLSTLICEREKITYIRNHLFSTGDAINPGLINALTQFIVLNSSVNLYYNGICKDELLPPTLVNPILPLKISHCGYLNYQIPENTFSDVIDGSTRQMVLSLKFTNGSGVQSKHSYITFDKTKQILKVIPVAQYLRSLHNPIVFILTAKTKRGLSVATNLQLSIPTTPPKFNFYFKATVEWRGAIGKAFTDILEQFAKKTTSFLGFKDQKMSFLEAIKSTTSNLFSIKGTFCTLTYEHCDEENIQKIKEKILNVDESGVNSEYQTKHQPQFYIISLSIFLQGPCKGENQPPKISRHIPNITIDTCSTFEFSFDVDTFVDTEDGNDLSYIIISINGETVNSEKTWLSVISGRSVAAVVNEEVFLASQMYHLVVRAYDSKKLFADAPWIITINGNKDKSQGTKIYYKFQMEMSPKSSTPSKFVERYLITRLINTALGKNTTNYISFEYDSKGIRKYIWSSCSLPKFCDPNKANILLNTFQSKSFKEIINTLYDIISLKMISDQSCEGSLNPPVALRTEWNLQINICGGRSFLVPADIFKDTEDGNARNLQLSFQPQDHNKQLPDWIFFDTSSQIFHIFPTYSEAKTFTLLPYLFILKATDRSGLSASILVYLTITLPPQEAKFLYTFQYQMSSITRKVEDKLSFSSKIAEFLNSSIQHVAIYSIKEVVGAVKPTRTITYGNCSIFYNPCDLAALRRIKNLLIDKNNFPLSSFHSAMLPFQIQYGTVKREPPCIDSFNPPIVLKKIPTITISYCLGYFEYEIPETTFYDNQDGATRKLQLTLLREDKVSLGGDSWVQFDTSIQKMYLFPIVFALDNKKVSRNSTFILKAEDSTKLHTNTPVTIQTYGQRSTYIECQIMTEFSSNKNNENLVQQLQYLNSKLRNFFGLKAPENIIIVKYIQTSQQAGISQHQLFWSYCSGMQTTDKTSPNFVTRILMRLFKNDDSIIPEFFTVFGSGYKISKVQTMFTGQCQNLPPIVTPNMPPISLSFSSCGYSQMTIDAFYFYDYEQGNTRNLELQLYTKRGVKVPLEHWVNIDQPTQSLIVVCNDFLRNTFTQSFDFILKAVDIAGEKAETIITIFKAPFTRLNVAPFDITLEMQYTRSLQRPYVYHIMNIIQKLQLYYSLPNSSTIYIKSYEVIPGYKSYRKITWTDCSSKQCNANGILRKTKGIYTEQNTLKLNFKNIFLSEFRVERVYYMSTQCKEKIDPPFIQVTVPPLSIKYCELFFYKLPTNTFFDGAEGDMRRLKLYMTLTNNTQLPSTSMMQLNSATMEIYGVHVSSYSTKNTNYKLHAVNSLKLGTSTEFSVTYDNSPFIADCPITMTFTYKYFTAVMPDIDVLINVINVIKTFFKDSVIMVKVLSFYRNNDDIFSVTWTNCSFQFSTNQEALKGLTSTQTDQLTNIFSKLLDPVTKIINPSFKNVFDRDFNLLTVSTSYQCVEKPPKPDNSNPLTGYARYCRTFELVLPNDLFTDEKDGDIRSMTIELAYENRNAVFKNEWLQINTHNKSRQFIYGTVTKEIENNANNRKYRYIIVCTDTSGRKATKQFIVTIIPLNDHEFTNEFIVGFKSYLDESLPNAFVLLTLLQKLNTHVKDIDESKQIYVKKFYRNSFIQFSYCQLPCTINTFEQIYNRFQSIKFETEPSLKLKQAFRNEFETSYVYINSYKCLPSFNITIISKPCPEVTVPICSYFTRKIPQDCFTDSLVQPSKNFFITMQTVSGQEISRSSWLQYDIPTQSVKGIVVLDKVFSIQNYQLIAQQPISGKENTNILKVVTENYSSINAVSKEICKITLEFKDTPRYSDVDIEIIQDISTTIEKYTNTNGQGENILVTSFSRGQDFMSVTYTNCSWVKEIQNGTPTTSYLQNVYPVLERYFRINELKIVGLTNSFAGHLQKSGYELVRVLTSNGCTTSFNTPPVPKKEITIDLKIICGSFTYLVPEDTFKDKRFGNTRQLTLEILAENNKDTVSWLSVNENQEICGHLDENVIRARPDNGYQFLLKATNKVGQGSTTRIYIKIPNKEWKVEKSITLTMFIQAGIIESPVKYKVSLLQHLKNYAPFKNLLSEFFVSKILSEGRSVEFSYCEQCSTMFYLLTGSLHLNNRPLQLWMSQKFVTFSVIVTRPEDVNEFSQHCKPFSLGTPVTKEVKFCSRNIFKLCEDYTELVENYEVKFLTEVDTPLSRSSWINLLKNPYRVIAYPTNTIWSQQPKEGYRYKIVLQENGKIVGTPQVFAFNISAKPNEDGVKYDLIVKKSDNKENIKSDVYYITSVWKELDLLAGANASLQHLSFQRTALNPLSFIISFYNCSLLCERDSSVSFMEKLPTTTFNGMQITGAKTDCSNNPPTITNNITITIPVCGLFTYSLPDSFAVDSKDGSLNTLDVELRNTNGSSLGLDSWILFDKDRKEIRALPYLWIVNSAPDTGLRFLLVVTDKSNKKSTSILFVRFEEYNQVPYHMFTILITSNYPSTTPSLDIAQNTVSYFARYADESPRNYRVLEIVRIDPLNEIYKLIIQNCSISKYTCLSEKQKLETLSKSITDNNNADFKRKIYRVSAGKITVNTISYQSTSEIDRPPIARGSISEIQVTYCMNVKYNIPDNIFYDEEKLQPTYKFYHDNGKMVDFNYWVNIFDNNLYAAPLITNAPGVYKFKLRTFDMCNHTAEIPITIKLSGDNRASGYSMTMRLQIDTYDMFSISRFLWDLRLHIWKCLRDDTFSTDVKSENGVRSEMFRYINMYLEYKWSLCQLETEPTCKSNDIEKATYNMFSSPNVVKNEFKKCLKKFNLKDIIENRSKNCVLPNPPPQVKYEPKFTVMFCSKVQFSIPLDVFVDENDTLITKNLSLELLQENFEPLPQNEWLQFDSITNTVYGYPRTGENTKTIKRNYTYKLKGTDDKTGVSSSTNLHITIVGTPTLNFIISLKGRYTSTLTRPDIALEIDLIKKIRKLYQVNEINDVSFSREGADIELKWSTCEMTDVCNCLEINNYIQKTTVQSVQNALGNSISITKVYSEKRDRCNEGPEVRNPMEKPPTLYIGQCYQYEIPSDSFYDPDGVTYEIKAQITQTQNKNNLKWLKMHPSKKTICGIIPYESYQSERHSFIKGSINYDLVAKDNCQNELLTTVSVPLDVTSYEMLGYVVIITINRQKEQLLGDCSDFESLITKIADYSKVDKIDIYVKSVDYYNSTYTNYTTVSWGYRELRGVNCSNETLTYYHKMFFTNGTFLSRTFIEYMKPEYIVSSAKNRTFGACALLTKLQIIIPENDFPWWIIYILIGIGLLALLIWCCWLCFPRCCSTCCRGGNCCGKCCSSLWETCCTRNGPYPSFKIVESDILAKPTFAPITNVVPPPNPDIFNRENNPTDKLSSSDATDGLISTRQFSQLTKEDIDALPMDDPNFSNTSLQPDIINEPLRTQEKAVEAESSAFPSAVLSPILYPPQQITIESYTDERLNTLETRSQANRDKRREVRRTSRQINDENGEYFIERYQGKQRPSIIMMDEFPHPRSTSTEYGKSSRQYKVTDALIDVPFMYKTNNVYSRRFRERRKSEGEIIVMKTRRKGKSHRERMLSTLTSQVEYDLKQLPITRVKKPKEQKVALVHKTLGQLNRTVSPRRSKNLKKIEYIDNIFQQQTENPIDKYYFLRRNRTKDYTNNHKTIIESRGRNRRQHFSGSLTSESVTDSAGQESNIKQNRKLPTVHLVTDKKSTTNRTTNKRGKFVFPTKLTISTTNRRQRSITPTRLMTMNPYKFDRDGGSEENVDRVVRCHTIRNSNVIDSHV